MNPELVIHRKAYHRLILPDGTVLSPGVVLSDDRGSILSWHQLRSEEPFTEWVGGRFIIRPAKHETLAHPNNHKP